MFPRAKKFIYNTLQFNNNSKLTTALNTFIIILILLSVPIDVLESVKDPPISSALPIIPIYLSALFSRWNTPCASLPARRTRNTPAP